MGTQPRPHSLTSVHCHSDSTFSNFFSSKNTRPFAAKFHMESPWDVEMKRYSNVLGHMTKMASRPYILKIFTSLLRNQKADDLEIWYTDRVLM